MRPLRRNLLRVLCGLPLLGMGQARADRRVLLQHSPLLPPPGGVVGLAVPGERLTLRREYPVYDPRTVALYAGERRVGQLPPTQSHTIATLLEQGYRLEAEAQPSPSEHHADRQQLQVALYLYP